MALRVLHPEGIALELLDLCCTQLAPEGILVVQKDVALPVAWLACDGFVPVGILQPHSRIKGSGKAASASVGRLRRNRAAMHGRPATMQARDMYNLSRKSTCGCWPFQKALRRLLLQG